MREGLHPVGTRDDNWQTQYQWVAILRRIPRQPLELIEGAKKSIAAINMVLTILRKFMDPPTVLPKQYFSLVSVKWRSYDISATVQNIPMPAASRRPGLSRNWTLAFS
jgi:hypothetical protein